MRRFLRIYLFCIVLPALAVGWGGLRLLRIDARNRASIVAENRRLWAERCADDFRERVRGALDERLDRIAEAPDAAARLAVLRDLSRGDPAVRAAFLWREGAGCAWPRRAGAPKEDRRFLDRYEPLFSGAVPWTMPAAADAAAPAAPDASAEPRGYRPWGGGGAGSDLLAWVRVSEREIAGFELETMWLLSRFGRFPLMDGMGLRNAWHRSRRTAMPRESGEIVDEDGAVLVPSWRRTAEPTALEPVGEASLAPLFPHWRLRMKPTVDALSFAGWMPDDLLDGARNAPRFRLVVGAALLALVLLSLVAGGYVLLRAARRERLDSLRKTDFVSNVSHELRTPLTSIRVFSELLAEDRISDPARRRRALGTVAAESARLSRLVDGVLDFSRLEQNRRTYDLAPVDLGRFLAETQGAHCVSAPPGADSAVPHSSFAILGGPAGGGAAPVVLADRDAVRQILLNLLDNAAKYAPGAPPEVEVARLPDGRAALRVMDRGPGVPPREAKRIFDRFHRVDNAVTRETGGNGLGLAIARRLARGMGGDLAYRPREGGGAVFELVLPSA